MPQTSEERMRAALNWLDRLTLERVLQDLEAIGAYHDDGSFVVMPEEA